MGTILVGSILVVIVTLIIKHMVTEKKKGNSVVCGGDCKHCGGHCS
ncbi:FeoB-associated Cys-rich membrane protein [Anaerosporobacter sp.]